MEPHQTGVALSKTLFNCQRTNPLAMGKTTAKRFSSTKYRNAVNGDSLLTIKIVNGVERSEIPVTIVLN